MKRILSIILMMITTLGCAMAAEPITLKAIANGNYYAKGIYGVTPLQDGESYAQLSADSKQVVRHSFKNGNTIEVLFDVATARNAKLDKIDGFTLSPDESLMLIQTKTQKRYRHSFTATYYIYNVRNKTLTPLSNGGPQQAPLFSPDSHLIAFVRDNNLFLVKLLFNNSESQITKDGKWNEMINGLPDWVNEEEFTSFRSFDFSADSQMLAWIRYDESNVKEFNFPLYQGQKPSKDDYKDYPGSYSYKYPIAGETNSKVTVHTFDIKSKVERTMKFNMDADGYIPFIRFTQDADKLAIVTLNRHQNRMELWMGNPRSTVCQMVLREQADKYINEPTFKNIVFFKNHFMLQSERSGYNHLYYYTMGGTLVKQLTAGNWCVKTFYGGNEDAGEFFFAGNEGNPTQLKVCKVDAKGKVTCLSQQKGTNAARFSSTYQYFMNTYSNVTTPTVTTLCSKDGKTLKVLEDNAELKQKLTAMNLGKPEFFTFKTSEGVELNGWMIKPAQFNANQKYPVVMYQYGGPSSQEVMDRYNIGITAGGMFDQYLAQEGFIVVCVDGRGTGGRGADFEKCTFLNLGDKESKDQVEAALYLSTLPYVDKNNIGIWGWSFGGFNTLMSLSEGRNVFKAGVAVAPVTSWKYYDTVFTERYMHTPNENPSGYNCCPIGRANQLNGALLICHGTADDNVHYRNTAEYAETLVQADKDFDMQVYTNRNHNINGGNTRCHLYRRIANFFKANLK